MSRISPSKAVVLVTDTNGQQFSCFRIRDVSSGDTLDLSTVFSNIGVAIGIGTGGTFLVPDTIQPSSARFPTILFGNANQSRQTAYLLVLGDPV